MPNNTLFYVSCHSWQLHQHWAVCLQTDNATEIHTESEMQQASEAMREALKGDSAASAAISDVDRDAALEMVRTGSNAASCLMHQGCQHLTAQHDAFQVPVAVNIDLRQQLEDMGFSANK